MQLGCIADSALRVHELKKLFGTKQVCRTTAGNVLVQCILAEVNIGRIKRDLIEASPHGVTRSHAVATVHWLLAAVLQKLVGS